MTSPGGTAKDGPNKEYESHEEINYFREYLRIKSVHPNIDYEPCLKFLHCQACKLELPMRVYYPVNDRNPVVILTWCGSDPGKKSILLNSHMDVVPVYEDNWKHPPFAAEMDADGKIYGRGAQDMKCVGMQYLAAIRSLKNSGATYKRTIHISFVPDEEMGGKLGMRAFVQTKEFRDLNVGFALDEGIASPNDTYTVFYAERSVWRVYFKICGNAGHGSQLVEKTAPEKLHFIMNKMMEMRQENVKRLADNPELNIGDVTSINLTRINGGTQSNVIPTEITACFDVRLALDINLEDFEEKLECWCDEAGGDITIEYEQKRPRVEPTKLDETNPFWLAFKDATDEMGLKIKLQIFTGGTDSRYIRELGIPALGFSPMSNTPILLHDNDEYLAADVFLKGIQIYSTLICKLGNATKCTYVKKKAQLEAEKKAQQDKTKEAGEKEKEVTESTALEEKKEDEKEKTGEQDTEKEKAADEKETDDKEKAADEKEKVADEKAADEKAADEKEKGTDEKEKESSEKEAVEGGEAEKSAKNTAESSNANNLESSLGEAIIESAGTDSAGAAPKEEEPK